MHIPLDYYRVLGLPIQATASQLSHAYRDRTLQLPRREFSEWAIAARRQLIDEAYGVLSDPIQRQSYDTSFLAKPYEMELGADSLPSTGAAVLEGETAIETEASMGGVGVQVAEVSAPAPIPRIEIHDNQFIGALLLLYELGEYELALRLGRPYLASGGQSLADGKFGDPQIIAADIVLTIALSCLELGREQWQQGQYEAAAESLETGQELLLREGLFASVRGEIQADLYKLRPYRILELLALPEERTVERYQGLRLLHDILQERGGIDGKGNDQSGLNTDDFLRFIQQLRGYLTVAEQQQIFENEANRPSAVGTYLTVYSLIAAGFAHRQPALIQTATQYLARLGHRQDVLLEQSICALLLGQTEKANYLVEHSQEEDTLEYIRKHSSSINSPDLLPGLCLYTEQWFQSEVFPQFRDLSQEDVSLKGYFADASVQAYLEALPFSDEEQPIAAPVAAGSASTTSRLGGHGPNDYTAGSDRAHFNSAQSNLRAGQNATTYGDAYGGSDHSGSSPRAGAGVSATATRDDHRDTNSNTTLHPAQRVSQLSPEGSLSQPTSAELEGSGNLQPIHSDQLRNIPHGVTLSPRHKGQPRPRIDRILLLAALGLVGILIMWIIASRIYGWISQTTRPSLLPGEQLSIEVNQPPVPIPPVVTDDAVTNEINGGLNEQSAEAVIRAWLKAKKAAMGPDHDVSLLEDVLIDAPLASWQGSAVTAQQNDFYLTYEHPELVIESVTWSEDAPDTATIVISITEVGEFYSGGELDPAQSYSSPLNVTYGVVKDNGRWKIQTISSQD